MENHTKTILGSFFLLSFVFSSPSVGMEEPYNGLGTATKQLQKHASDMEEREAKFKASMEQVFEGADKISSQYIRLEGVLDKGIEDTNRVIAALDSQARANNRLVEVTDQFEDLVRRVERGEVDVKTIFPNLTPETAKEALDLLEERK